jgi:hypothetical protein
VAVEAAHEDRPVRGGVDVAPDLDAPALLSEDYVILVHKSAEERSQNSSAAISS